MLRTNPAARRHCRVLARQDGARHQHWWALRQNGIVDKIDGFGSLLLKH
jgi:hypothetical protein